MVSRSARHACTVAGCFRSTCDPSFYYSWYRSTRLSIIPGTNPPVFLLFLVQSRGLPAHLRNNSPRQRLYTWRFVPEMIERRVDLYQEDGSIYTRDNRKTGPRSARHACAVGPSPGASAPPGSGSNAFIVEGVGCRVYGLWFRV